MPVKNCLFICSTGLINRSLIACQSGLGLVPWILVIKGGHRYVQAPSRKILETWGGLEGGDGGNISHLFLSLGRIKADP